MPASLSHSTFVQTRFEGPWFTRSAASAIWGGKKKSVTIISCQRNGRKNDLRKSAEKRFQLAIVEEDNLGFEVKTARGKALLLRKKSDDGIDCIKTETIYHYMCKHWMN
jgi:hypothetical protein